MKEKHPYEGSISVILIQGGWGHLVYLLEGHEEENQTNQRHGAGASGLKISCLNHIFKAVDIEPMTGRIEHADGVLPLQQFLEQLGDAGFAVGWLG